MFHVCRRIYGPDTTWWLEGGLMQPQPNIGGGTLFTDLNPKLLSIWLEKIDGLIYNWQITVNTSDDQAPVGRYDFFDETGDIYTLWARLPGKHTVSYNSSKPFINKIRILLDFPYQVGDWPNAPICSGS